MPKKVFVSGCFDLLHSGHVAFFEEAAHYGDLYVAIGSDRNVFELKRRRPINNQAERLYMIKSLATVKQVFVAKGSGILDFVQELREIKPDYFVVNPDGSTPEKKKLCDDLGIEYVVLERKPHARLTPRSTTALRSASLVPDSLILAGGLFSEPEISRLSNGPVLALSIHPLDAWSSRTRKTAIELWESRLPVDDPEKLAKILFGYGNLPGASEIHGSPEALGLTLPGLTRLDFAGGYWPEQITPLLDEQVLKFIEDSLYLLPLDPTNNSASPFRLNKITAGSAKALASPALNCWQALLECDLSGFGRAMQASFEAQVECWGENPLKDKESLLEHSAGWNISGNGSQPILMLVSERPLENTLRANIRRASD
ncbi:MAG TPA: adenylyltransferase/cytidyltransferase family protein [Anaerolineales bacterium]|jgi:cytidyltransferase-like protein